MATVGIPMAFDIVKIGNLMDEGTRMTSFGMGHQFHIFDDQTSGFLGIASAPVLLKEDPRLTWEGYLNTLNDGTLLSVCLDGDGDIDWDAANAPSITSFHYGATGGTTLGFVTSYCIGTRLQITGRPNELVAFTCDMFGLQTSLETLTAQVPTARYYYPWERGVFSIGTAFGTYVAKADTCFGFTINYDTGYYPQFALDGLQYYTGVGERKKACTVDIVMAQGATCLAEYAKWAAGTPTSYEFVLTASDGTTTFTIEVYGFYTAFDYGDQDGLMIANATMTGHYDASNTEMFQITIG